MAKIVEKIEVTDEEMCAYNLLLNMVKDIMEDTENNYLYTACTTLADNLENFFQEWIN